MAADRTYDIKELVRLISQLQLFTIPSTTHGDTTIATSPVTQGAATVTVAAATNFIDQDYALLIGQGGEADLLQVSGAPVGTTITLAQKSAIAAAVGSRFVEMSAVDLGHLDESGITMTGSANIVDIPASTSKLPLASYLSTGTLGGSANLRGFNVANMQAVFGIAENVLGTGSTTDPFTAPISGLKMGSQSVAVLRGKGTMVDGVSTFWLDFVQATIAPSLNTQVGGTNPATLGLQFRCTAIVPRFFK